jgi:hypothetical protein
VRLQSAISSATHHISMTSLAEGRVLPASMAATSTCRAPNNTNNDRFLKNLTRQPLPNHLQGVPTQAPMCVYMSMHPLLIHVPY